MARRLVWSARAELDLLEIELYIERDSPQNAKLVIRRLIAAAEGIPDFPFRGPPVPERSDQRYRQLIVSGFRLIYRVADEAIEIVHHYSWHPRHDRRHPVHFLTAGLSPLARRRLARSPSILVLSSPR